MGQRYEEFDNSGEMRDCTGVTRVKGYKTGSTPVPPPTRSPKMTKHCPPTEQCPQKKPPGTLGGKTRPNKRATIFIFKKAYLG